MQNSRLLIVGIALGWLAIACEPRATEEETKEMCSKLVELRGEVEVVTVKDAITVLDESYAQKEKEILAQKQTALTNLDGELTEALGEVKKDDEKTKVENEFAARRETLNAAYAAKLDELKPEREAEADKITQRAELSRAEWEKAVDACLSDPLIKGTTQRVANCRLQSASLDEFWNSCR